ncbi:hypothetical protein CCAX7_51740 [Capsulimonas corticalis]|uniref:Uncharacterized protein n=1 Tax=Capsulimonas corticalis TaxID=2219043 RepID=A0A402CPB9_9BACT|nr:hypothetical protein [Capsulimonas corticalis]BDI33123.1 hypothetical protein CCAX7_51740 [Capsulimonas corticalis]
MMTNEIVLKSVKRVAAGLACVALLSQVVPTVGTAMADKYSSDDNTGTTVLVVAGVGAVVYYVSHTAYVKNHPRLPSP